MNSFIGTKEAARRLNITIRRVQALIAAGRLPAEKIGNSYAIKESDLALVNGRKNGRAPKQRERTQEEWNTILEPFIGCLDGLPSDLSTNPKYMEGLGRDK
jgi:excisionase family DNA binding protein